MMEPMLMSQGELNLRKFLYRNGVNVTWLSGSCPTQAEGEVDGKFFYYRSRSDYWYVSIADTVDDAIGGDDDVECFVVKGTDKYFGYVPFEVALAYIWKAVKQYRQSFDSDTKE